MKNSESYQSEASQKDSISRGLRLMAEEVDRRGEQVKKSEDAILKFLQENPEPITTSALWSKVGELGVPRSSARDATSYLEYAGRIVIARDTYLVRLPYPGEEVSPPLYHF